MPPAFQPPSDNDDEDLEVQASEPEPVAGVTGVAPGNTHAHEPYLGTDPVYQNHANATEAPLPTEIDEDASEEELKSAYIEATAGKNFEEAKAAGMNLGISGFTVPSVPEPPRTVREVVAYEKDKAERLAKARAEAEKHPAPRF